MKSLIEQVAPACGLDAKAIEAQLSRRLENHRSAAPPHLERIATELREMITPRREPLAKEIAEDRRERGLE